MKTLVVSLLRLGDFLMLTPTLRALKSEGKCQQLHVLVHSELLMLKPLFPEIDVWHVLDRNALQSALGTSDSNFFLAHDLLFESLQRINADKYDSVINLTHTEFSGWVCGVIDCKDRLGLHYDINGKADIHSSWFQYLNNHVAAGSRDIFHMSDILFYGSGVTGPQEWEILDTQKGLQEASTLVPEGSPFIALQTRSSDNKKDWSQGDWLVALEQLKLFLPSMRYVVLGAPSEREELASLVHKANGLGIPVTLAICSFEGALAIIRRAKLLMSVDTSIKHLACGTKTPVLELCMGPSDYRKTGVYKQDSIILSGRISPELVALTALHLSQKRFSEIRKIAFEFQTEANVLQTHICPMGFWLALPLSDYSEDHILHLALERSTWKFILQREYLKPLAQFGSEGLTIKRWLQDSLSEWSVPRLSEGLSFLENETASTDQEVNGLLNTLRRITDRGGKDLDFQEGIEDLRSFFENSEGVSSVLPWLSRLHEVSAQPGLIPITSLRKVQSSLDEVFQKTQVKLKLIRSLKSQL